MITMPEKKTGLMCAVLALCLGICPAAMAEGESGDHPAATAAGHEADSHGDGAPEANTNPLSVDPDLALFTALVFVCLLLVLWKMAWNPIMAGLSAREEGIAANIDQAQQDAEAAAAKLQEYEEQLTAATEEARTIMAKAQGDAQAAWRKRRKLLSGNVTVPWQTLKLPRTSPWVKSLKRAWILRLAWPATLSVDNLRQRNIPN